MIVTLRTERVRTPEQVRAFVKGSEAVDPRTRFRGAAFAEADRGSVCEFLRCTLVRLSHEGLGKPDKGLVRRSCDGHRSSHERPRMAEAVRVTSLTAARHADPHSISRR